MSYYTEMVEEVETWPFYQIHTNLAYDWTDMNPCCPHCLTLFILVFSSAVVFLHLMQNFF